MVIKLEAIGPANFYGISTRSLVEHVIEQNVHGAATVIDPVLFMHVGDESERGAEFSAIRLSGSEDPLCNWALTVTA